jgi:hypothetical protein
MKIKGRSAGGTWTKPAGRRGGRPAGQQPPPQSFAATGPWRPPALQGIRIDIHACLPAWTCIHQNPSRPCTQILRWPQLRSSSIVSISAVRVSPYLPTACSVYLQFTTIKYIICSSVVLRSVWMSAGRCVYRNCWATFQIQLWTPCIQLEACMEEAPYQCAVQCWYWCIPAAGVSVDRTRHACVYVVTTSTTT